MSDGAPSRMDDVDLSAAPAWRDGRECAIVRRLDHHPVAEVETGEVGVERDGAVPWRVRFDYDEPQVVASAVADFRQRYRAIAARQPTVRARWNVYASDAAAPSLAYLKHPCDMADLRTPFFQRLLPADARDVAHGSAMRPGDMVSRVFTPTDPFLRAAHLFDGKCMVEVPLGDWPVETVQTGQREADGAVLWQTTFHLDEERFRRAWRWAHGRRPAAEGQFDVHRSHGRLVYVREPCAAEDVRARFFLHVFPRDVRVLAAGKTAATSVQAANLDFDFTERGLLAEGRCVAIRRLPDYDIARIATGQFTGTGGTDKEVWRVELD